VAPGVTAALYGEPRPPPADHNTTPPGSMIKHNTSPRSSIVVPSYLVTQQYSGYSTLPPGTPSGKEQKKEQKMCALDRIYISQFLRRCPPSGVPCELLPRLLGWLKLRSTPHSARTTLSMAFRSAWFLHSRASTQASPPLPLSPCYQLTHYPHYIHGLRQGQSRLC